MMYKIFELSYGGLQRLDFLTIRVNTPTPAGMNYSTKDIPNKFDSMEEAETVLRTVYKNSKKVYHFTNLKEDTDYVILPTIVL